MVKLVKSRDEAFAPLGCVTLRYVTQTLNPKRDENVTYLRHSTLYVKTGKNM